ncbi:MAG: response regulator [Acidobacteria bacterium]|nr:response regulator [Acidobacteriota bacterium]
MNVKDPDQMAVCLSLMQAISRAVTMDGIYDAALDALADGLGVSRASILLFDADGVMRFKAAHGLSETYRRAVEGHTPWERDTPDPVPIVVPDVTLEPSLASHLRVIQAEGIAALVFVPLVMRGRVIGKFMLYDAIPRTLTRADLQLAQVIASQVAFAVDRMRAESQARRSEERLRFALDAAAMGTWDWDLVSNTVQWSENLERVHRLPPGTFDGTFASYEREIHPDDRERVLASARRAIEEGTPHEVEYRIVAPDGTVSWVEGKGQVLRDATGRPVHMTGVCMLVTRRKEAELARLANAEETSRLKDEFLATLSHELRTPMNAVLGWVQMMLSGTLPPERMRQAIEVIGRNARLQAQLVEDLLDVSRIVSGKLEIERQPVPVGQVIDNVVNGLLPAADAKGITLTTDVTVCPQIIGDAKRLEQVLANVLSNAIKFTPEGGRVELRCALADDMIEIEVRDTGAGIAPEFLPFIFDRFRQADSRSTRTHGGLGLGLAIARHLLQLHDGEIRAHSDGVGRGTTVTIRMPAGPGGAAAPAGAPSRGAEPGERFRMDGATVVVVDDQADSREVLGVLLEESGARVILCEDAIAALAALENAAVDLLVADLAMPHIDGYELIRRVRQKGSAVPAVAVSAFARIEDRTRARTTGFNGYCTKPIDAAYFRQVIREVMLGVA